MTGAQHCVHMAPDWVASNCRWTHTMACCSKHIRVSFQSGFNVSLKFRVPWLSWCAARPIATQLCAGCCCCAAARWYSVLSCDSCAPSVTRCALLCCALSTCRGLSQAWLAPACAPRCRNPCSSGSMWSGQCCRRLQSQWGGSIKQDSSTQGRVESPMGQTPHNIARARQHHKEAPTDACAQHCRTSTN
jgi:hypothetical protein